MTVQVIQMFPPTLLTGSLATLYTMPASPSNIVLNRGMVRFTNTDGSAHQVTGNAIVTGGSATVTNTFCPGVDVPANSTLDVAVPVLAASDFLQFKASTTAVVSIQSLDGVLFS